MANIQIIQGDIFDVPRGTYIAHGKPYNVDRFDSKYYNFNYEALQKACPGANCLHAHAGEMLRNDEIIVYKEEQCSIKYLIELE